jgi:hydroxyethylthiazole kinase-like uncharacterized protein yjeF
VSGPVVRSLTNRWVAGRLLARPARAHKGDFGRVLVVGGSAEYPGAALLAGLGAMRAGAGVVQVASARTVADRLAGVVPELTWLVLDEEAPGLIAPSGWRLATSAAGIVDAIVIGPGLGRLQGTQRRVRILVGTVGAPTVVDADGLNALAEDARWPQDIDADLVLTPHPGEFARLTGNDAPPGDDDAARAAAAAEAAEGWGQVVVLKGAHTVVAAPGGQVVRSSVASPALATAGSGDVLAGVIAAFLAGGAPGFEAAACGVAVHAAAGVLAQRRIGRTGTMARDIAGLLPEAIERLRSGRAG